MVWGTAGIQLQRQRFPQWDTLNCRGEKKTKKTTKKHHLKDFIKYKLRNRAGQARKNGKLLLDELLFL